MNNLTPITVKLTLREKEQVSQMADLHNSYLSDILRWGIEMMWEQYSYEAEALAEERTAIARRLEENTMDRVTEVNQIRELAANIAANLGEGTAEELVAYALSDEGREPWGIDIQLDTHDRKLLVQLVDENL